MARRISQRGGYGMKKRIGRETTISLPCPAATPGPCYFCSPSCFSCSSFSSSSFSFPAASFSSSSAEPIVPVLGSAVKETSLPSRTATISHPSSSSSISISGTKRPVRAEHLPHQERSALGHSNVWFPINRFARAVSTHPVDFRPITGRQLTNLLILRTIEAPKPPNRRFRPCRLESECPRQGSETRLVPGPPVNRCSARS